MAANAQITIEPFCGAENENFREFEQLFRGIIGVAAVPAGQQVNFLQLHLRDAALRFFQTLDAATRADVDLTLAALRDHFCNVQLQEVHILKLEQQKFDLKKDTPENFLVTLQTKAQRAYPTPDLPKVAPLALAGLDPAPAAAEQTRFDSETATRAARLQAAEDHKNEQVKRIFIKAMPGWLRSKIMEQPPATPVQDLCTFARQQMTIREMCRKEDYPEDGFNEISPALSENLINALSKLTANQEQMERQLKNMDEKLQASNSTQTNQDSEDRFQNLTQQQPYNPNPQNRRFANFNGNFRPGLQNRGQTNRPSFPIRSRNYQSRFTQPFQPRSYQARPSNQIDIRLPTAPTCQLRKPVKHFAIFAVTQIIQQANASAEVEVTREDLHFHFIGSQKTSKATQNNKNRKNAKRITKYSFIYSFLNNVTEANQTVLSYIKLQFSPKIVRRALIDTGACANVISRRTYDELIADPNTHIKRLAEKPQWDQVKMAGGQTIKVTCQVQICFKLAHRDFNENFLVLPSANSIILGNPFFKKHEINIFPAKNLIQFEDLTVQVNEIKPKNEPRRTIKPRKVPIYTTRKITIKPNEHSIIECKLVNSTESLDNQSGIIVPNEKLEQETEIALTSSLSTVGANNTLFIAAVNITDRPITIKNQTEIARFSILTAEQAQNLTVIDPELISLAKHKSSENTILEINQLIQDFCRQGKNQPPRPAPEYEKLWFPTPETCNNPDQLQPLQKEIYDQITRLQHAEKLNPSKSEEDRYQFLEKLPWQNTSLNEDERKQVENLLVEYHDIFAKHRFDVGYNTELKIKLTPEHDLPIYTQSPPTPIHLRDELHIELALMHYYGLITT